MQEFESYIKSNYHVHAAAATAIKYTYTSRHVQDRKSRASILNHIITMSLTFFDSTGKQLASEKLTFVNDTITKSCEKQLKLISPAEATNKFRAAKQQILRQLINAKQQKINVLQEDINSLTSYSGSNHDIIPTTFKGTLTLTPTPAPTQHKHSFDM